MCHHRQRKDMRMTTKGVKSLKKDILIVVAMPLQSGITIMKGS